jgi:hypothetical protein
MVSALKLLAYRVIYRPDISIPNPRLRVQFGQGAVLQHSNTPSPRAAEFDDEDDDEDENEAPCGRTMS